MTRSKVCHRCGVEKTLECYYRTQHGTAQARCKPCTHARKRELYGDEHRASARKWWRKAYASPAFRAAHRRRLEAYRRRLAREALFERLHILRKRPLGLPVRAPRRAKPVRGVLERIG